MPVGNPSESCEDVDALKQRLLAVAGAEILDYLKSIGKTVGGTPDRDIVWLIANPGFGCPDITSLKMIGSMSAWDDFYRLMDEEGKLAQSAGHILKVCTGYKAFPEIRLLVLDLEKSELKGRVRMRVRNVGGLGVKGAVNLMVHEIEAIELLKAIRAA